MNQILPIASATGDSQARPGLLAYDTFVLARVAASIAFVRWLETATAEEIALEADGTGSQFRQLADIELQIREARS